VLGKGSSPCALASDDGNAQGALGGVRQGTQIDLFDIVPNVSKVFYSAYFPLTSSSSYELDLRPSSETKREGGIFKQVSLILSEKGI
jgi:hypothetical protein